jgi:F-type H+-transporting ATPase subunit b
MDLITPDIGLLFWMLISFSIVLVILKKFAWKPILGALKEREDSIENSLSEARKAREEMALLKRQNEDLLKEAQHERDNMLKEARDTKSSIISEAKNKAKEEADKVLQQAREEITSEKKAAIDEIKSQVASLSIEIAERILKTELGEDKKQKVLIDNLLEEIKLN